MVIGCMSSLNPDQSFNQSTDTLAGFRPPVETHLKASGKMMHDP